MDGRRISSDDVGRGSSVPSGSGSQEPLISDQDSSGNTNKSFYQRFTEWRNSKADERRHSTASGSGSELLSTALNGDHGPQHPDSETEGPSAEPKLSCLASCGVWTSSFCRNLTWTMPNCCDDMSSPFRQVPVEIMPTILANRSIEAAESDVALSDIGTGFDDGGALAELERLHVQRLKVLEDQPDLMLDKNTADRVVNDVKEETTAMVNTLWAMNFSSMLGLAYIIGSFVIYKVLTDSQIANESSSYDTCIDKVDNPDSEAVQSNCRVSAQLTNVKDMINSYESNYIIYGIVLAVPAVALIIFVLERINSLVIAPCRTKKAEDVRSHSSATADADEVVPVLPISDMSAPLMPANQGQLVQYTSLQAVKDVVAEAEKLGEHRLGLASAFLAINYAKPLLGRQQQYDRNVQARRRLAIILLASCFISALASMKIYSISVANDNLDDCELENAAIDDDALYDTNVYDCIENAIFDAVVVKNGVREPVMGVEDALIFLLLATAISLLFSAKELPVRAMPTFRSNVDDVETGYLPPAAAAALAGYTMTQRHTLSRIGDAAAASNETLVRSSSHDLLDKLEEIRRAASGIVIPETPLAVGENVIDPTDLQQSIRGYYSDATGVLGFQGYGVPADIREVTGRESMGHNRLGVLGAGGVVAIGAVAAPGSAIAQRPPRQEQIPEAEFQSKITGLLNDFAQVLRDPDYTPARGINDGLALAIMDTHTKLMDIVNKGYEKPLELPLTITANALASVLIKMSDEGNVPMATTNPAAGMHGFGRAAPIVTGLKPVLEAVLGDDLNTSVTAGVHDSNTVFSRVLSQYR